MQDSNTVWIRCSDSAMGPQTDSARQLFLSKVRIQIPETYSPVAIILEIYILSSSRIHKQRRFSRTFLRVSRSRDQNRGSPIYLHAVQ